MKVLYCSRTLLGQTPTVNLGDIMSTTKKMFLFMALSILSLGVYAQEEGFSIGPKLAVEVDIDDVGDGDAIGVNLGYGFGNGWSIELDILTGDVDAGVDVDVDTKAVYGVYRSSGEGYFLGKIGYADGEASVTGFSADDTGLSYGFGGGYRFTDSFSLEGEYTVFDFDDIEGNIIAATARFHF
jgi:hypothetical protein